MGIFGFGKKEQSPSRAEFDSAKKKLEMIKGENIAIHRDRDVAQEIGPTTESWDKVHYEMLEGNHAIMNAIRDKLAEMLEANQEEAIDLDNEYNKLLKKAKEAVDKLHAFEAEKLGGMYKEKSSAEWDKVLRKEL